MVVMVIAYFYLLVLVMIVELAGTVVLGPCDGVNGFLMGRNKQGTLLMHTGR